MVYSCIIIIILLDWGQMHAYTVKLERNMILIKKYYYVKNGVYFACSLSQILQVNLSVCTPTHTEWYQSEHWEHLVQSMISSLPPSSTLKQMLHTHTSVACKFCWAIICSSGVGLDSETNCCLFRFVEQNLSCFLLFSLGAGLLRMFSSVVEYASFAFITPTALQIWLDTAFNVSQLSHEQVSLWELASL